MIVTTNPIIVNAETEMTTEIFDSTWEYSTDDLPDGFAQIVSYLGNSEKNVIIPSEINGLQVAVIRSKVFYNHKEIESISIPDSIEVIGSGAFCGCTSLDNVTLPAKLISLYSSTFKDCTNLKNIVLNDGLLNIGSEAFLNCTSLEMISIPSSVEVMDANVFSDCTNLKVIKMLLSKTPSIHYYTFERCRPELFWLLESNEYTIGYCNNHHYKYTFDGNTIYQNGKVVNNSSATNDINNSSSVKDNSVKNPSTVKKVNVKKVSVKKPSSVKTTPKSKTILVSWKKVSGAKGYEIRYSTKSGMKGAKKIKASASKTKVTIKKLKRNKKYYIQVRAYKKTNEGKVYSNWSKKVKTKTKK